MIPRPASLSSLSALRLSSIKSSILLLDPTCASRIPPATLLLPELSLRLVCSRPRCSHFRYFSQTSICRSSSTPPNHYEVLRIHHDATPSELKKQFYVLSKETHPDRNRNDPKAGERFAEISESYAVLANPEKRKRYDRDVFHVHHSHRAHHPHSHSHSHAARKTYAGHRPATGLSRRRSVFKGPPPSFYAHGKPSPNTTAQAQAHAEAGPGPYQAGTFNAGAYTDTDPAFAGFDPQSTYKTQTHEDYRRANRRAAELAALRAAAAEEDNFWGRFIIVSAIIVASVSVGTIVVSMANAPRGGLTRADGSRRDGPRNDWTKA
ncbi:hypothetical protein PV05_08244 [Exophiala xenobiotica]|uniref:J domain-containing protein n=1 Tax=Exophiala xenobiotica TaxID=348802 RepID=A0A0D2EXS6_9EURO|nr:uncharacterized protein PV05_08244 [Exophiala xenobiotica]KIW52614.1 hypothetical protein PV05_08244 [Exophiala xenobiotica]